jgi:hypothetical protein
MTRNLANPTVKIFPSGTVFLGGALKQIPDFPAKMSESRRLKRILSGLAATVEIEESEGIMKTTFGHSEVKISAYRSLAQNVMDKGNAGFNVIHSGHINNSEFIRQEQIETDTRQNTLNPLIEFDKQN